METISMIFLYSIFGMVIVDGCMTWYRHYEWIKEKALEQTFKDKDSKWRKGFYLKYCLILWSNILLFIYFS